MSEYDPNGSLVEMAGHFLEVIADADGVPIAIRDDGPVGPVMWSGKPGSFTEQMRAAGWIDMTGEESDEDDESG